MWDGGFGWHGPGMGLWGILFLVLLIVVVVVLVRTLIPGRTDNEPTADRALQILRERYARGEIDREEFEQKKHDLEQ